MSKKKEQPKPRKVKITFEVEESQTHCCECLFGATCPYACPIADNLDCAKYNLATLELLNVEPIEEYYKKERKEQIKQAAREAATIVEDVAENGNKYCTIIPEWQYYFERGANWADEHPAPFTPETHLGRDVSDKYANYGVPPTST